MGNGMKLARLSVIPLMPYIAAGNEFARRKAVVGTLPGAEPVQSRKIGGNRRRRSCPTANESLVALAIQQAAPTGPPPRRSLRIGLVGVTESLPGLLLFPPGQPDVDDHQNGKQRQGNQGWPLE